MVQRNPIGLLYFFAMTCLMSQQVLAGVPPAMMAGGSEIDFENPLLSVGVGYDAVSGDAKGECVTVGAQQPFSGMESIFEIKRVESTEVLNDEMNLSASAGLKFISGLGGSLKVQFAEERHLTSYSTFVLVKTIVRAPVVNAHNVKISDDYAALLKAADGQDQFRKSCGDFFINGFVSGGEFYGVIQIDSTDLDSKQNLESELSTSFGIFSTSAEFKQKLENIIQNRDTNLRAYQGGGTPATLTPSPDGLIELATKFPTTFIDASGNYNGRGVVYGLLIKPYSDLPPVAGAIVSPIVAQNQIQVLDRLNKFSLQFQRQINDIDYVQQHPERFEAPDLQALVKSRDAVIEMNNKVISEAQKCFADSINCTGDPTISFVQVALPHMKGGLTCKNPVYNTKEDVKCGIVFKIGTGSECGQICGVKADPTCGVAHWNVASGPVCAPIYKNGIADACPIDHQDCDCGSSALAQFHTFPPGKDLSPYCVCTQVHASCRTPANGIEGYESCENQAFGIKAYNSCQVCNGFATCRHPDFGIEKINSCRLPEFGVERCAD